MPDMEKTVAGIRCRQVLEKLSDFMDGDLTPDDARQVTEHVQGCDWCERFGGRFSGVVSGLRRELARADALAPDVEERLKRALETI